MLQGHGSYATAEMDKGRCDAGRMIDNYVVIKAIQEIRLYFADGLPAGAFKLVRSL
jgi:hypothetical protein